MVKHFNKIGATADGYRGKRAIVEQRIIEGLEQSAFSSGELRLTAESAQTQYLNNNNMADGYYMVLPKANDMWNNWKVCIINDSKNSLPIYYWSETSDNLHLFKELSAGNMVTCILVDSTTEEGTWTTLRTLDTISADTVEKYTSNVFDTIEIPFNNISSGDNNSVEFPLVNVLAGTAVRSIYIKPVFKFIGSTNVKISIGTSDNPTLFYDHIDISGDISNNNFSKDLFEEILSTESNVQLIATITGDTLNSLTAGQVNVTVERAKLIDPTILKNAIVNSTLPIGVIFNYAFNDLPDGYLRLDGTTLTNARQTAPQFVAKLEKCNNTLVGEKLIVGKDEWERIYNTNGSCGKFAWYGPNLRLPAINCFIRGLSDLTQLGRFQTDTMRPITGTMQMGGVNGGSQGYQMSGAFIKGDYGIGPGGGQDGGSWAADTSKFKFDSGNLGANYSGSETQPKSVKFPYIVCVFNKIQWSSEVDYNELIASTVYKADRDLDNVIQASNNFKTMSINWSMPDYNSVQDRQWGASYTTTEPGYLFVQVWTLFLSRAFIKIGNLNIEMGGNDDNDGGGSDTIMLPIGANVAYSTSGLRGTIKFIPCLK